MSKAVILLNMGAARSAPELKQFLYQMFKDKRIIDSPVRHLLAPVIAQTRYKKVWKKYELIGGSRLYDITRSLSQKLEKRLGYDVKYAMRYTSPYINEVILNYDELILLPLYPQYSTTTVESSLDAFNKTGFKGKLQIVKPFYQSEDFNKLIANKILTKTPEPSSYHLILTAHGLPQKIVDKGDPYEQQIKQQVQLLSAYLPQFKSIRLAYQSRFGNSPWLQPYLDDIIPDYKDEKVIVYPLSFMIDNSETDLELKIEYAELAQKHGVKSFQVVSCPNDSDETVEFLTKLIRQYDQ